MSKPLIVQDQPRILVQGSGGDSKQELENVKAAVLENKLVDWVLEQAKVTEKDEDFFSLVRETMPQQ